MDFIKKHYEKVLFGLVLVALVAAVAFLPFKISSERAELEQKKINLTERKVQALTNLNLTSSEVAFKRVTIPVLIDLGASNKVFNPIPWQKAVDGHLIKLDKKNIGPPAMVVTKVTKLYLTLTFDSTTVLESGPKYLIGVQREAAPKTADRGKKTITCSLNIKNDPVIVREVKGKPEDPTALSIELTDTGERMVLTKEQPFRRVDGYEVDLKYPPENKTWSKKRVGSLPALQFNNEDYNIVAISENEVVLSAKSNQKKWTIPYSATPLTTTTTTP